MSFASLTVLMLNGGGLTSKVECCIYIENAIRYYNYHSAEKLHHAGQQNGLKIGSIIVVLVLMKASLPEL